MFKSSFIICLLGHFKVSSLWIEYISSHLTIAGEIKYRKNIVITKTQWKWKAVLQPGSQWLRERFCVVAMFPFPSWIALKVWLVYKQQHWNLEIKCNSQKQKLEIFFLGNDILHLYYARHSWSPSDRLPILNFLNYPHFIETSFFLLAF